MNKIKKIALVTSASNFERQKNVIKAVHKKLKQLGDYALYVITSFGLYVEEGAYDIGEASIYSLLKEGDFDACILEGNIGREDMLQKLVDVVKEKNIPLVTLSFGMEGVPFFLIDSYESCCQIMEHLIVEHHCKKINMVAGTYQDIFGVHALKAYYDVLDKYHIPMEDERVVYRPVSIKNGQDLYHYFKENGIADADAILCEHDVFAIGLCLEMQKHGEKVPDDMKLCSLNRSTNSVVFRPDIAGADRADTTLAMLACEGLDAMLQGKEIPLENYLSGEVYFGESCGCERQKSNLQYEKYQELILGKIEAGNQISQMMQYNDSLESMDSVAQLGDSVKNMITGINCKEFVFCLNPKTLRYVTDEINELHFDKHKYFEDTMQAVIGITERTGEIREQEFPLKKLLPLEPKAGDLLFFLPVHYREQAYGYIAFVNENLPVDLYNYRICHESLGTGIENLHRQLILKKSIEKLDELHMKDAMTGIYNQFAIIRYAKDYVKNGNYCVVMLDMDGLKKVNDQFGHLAGNNAILITVEAMKRAIGENDLLIRYGGDEFQILSTNTDEKYWNQIRIDINRIIQDEVNRQHVPYELGISMGYCICRNGQLTLDACVADADTKMYENKRVRKQQKKLQENGVLQN